MILTGENRIIHISHFRFVCRLIPCTLLEYLKMLLIMKAYKWRLQICAVQHKCVHICCLFLLPLFLLCLCYLYVNKEKYRA